MSRPLLLVVVGSSAVGKTTLVHGLLKQHPKLFQHCITTTTREKRKGEKQHHDYHFLTEAQFAVLKSKKAFAETATIAAHHYGTQIRDLQTCLKQPKTTLLIVDRKGALAIKTHFPETRILVLEASTKELLKRLHQRGATKKDIALRIKRIPAEQQFAKRYADIRISTTSRTMKQTLALAKQQIQKLI